MNSLHFACYTVHVNTETHCCVAFDSSGIQLLVPEHLSATHSTLLSDSKVNNLLSQILVLCELGFIYVKDNVDYEVIMVCTSGIRWTNKTSNKIYGTSKEIKQ